MIEVGKLFKQAREHTGLSDFGEESFREPLERLVDSINRESQLSTFGQLALPKTLVGCLVNRLEVESWYTRHPEIEDEQIVAPVFGVGLPRTGSTALGFMLAQDRNTRVLRDWEAKHPCPPPETATEDSDPRIAETEAAAKIFDAVAPEINNVLPYSPRGPQECTHLLNLSFAPAAAFEAWGHVPTYAEWVMSPDFDMRPAYRYHRRVIKLLQWRCPPRRWFLRTPVHIFSLDALDAAYPDAQFVMTHRDPVKSLPSACSLFHMFRKAFVDNTVPQLFGKIQERHWAIALERALAFRDRVGEERFFDISHRRQIVDPVEQIRPLYGKLGWCFDEDLEARIRLWQENNPKGVHKLSPSFFGLDPEEIAQRYRFYSDRFAAMM